MDRNKYQGARLKLRLLSMLLLAFLSASAAATASGSIARATTLRYSTFLGSELTDIAQDIAVDSAGNVFITGQTSALHGFPMEPGAVQHGVDAFVAKLNPDGTAVDYALWFNAFTYDEDEGLAIAVDASGAAYVVGRTRSADFCRVFNDPPGYDTIYAESEDDGDAFLLKVRPDGSGLEYCTFLGGSEVDSAYAVAVDSAGSAYVAGSTWSPDFPTTADAFSRTANGYSDAFLVQFDPSGTELRYASYLGGSQNDRALALVAGDNGSVTVAGWTRSTDFPLTSNAPDRAAVDFDAFITRLKLGARTPVFSTYLGGGGSDRLQALAVTAVGETWIAGYTDSPDFPTTPGALDTTLDGAQDAFLARLSADGSQFSYATLLGGTGRDESAGLALRPDGAVLLIGMTGSPDFPTTPHALSATPHASTDAFVAQTSPDGGTLAYSTYLGGAQEDEATSIAVPDSSGVIVAGFTRSADFPTSPGAFRTALMGDYDAFVTHLSLPAEPTANFRAFMPLVTGAAQR